MEIKVYIEGMMCQHCAAHAKAALEALDGVDSVTVELENKRAIVTASANIPEAAIQTAIKDAGYTVTKIEN